MNTDGLLLIGATYCIAAFGDLWTPVRSSRRWLYAPTPNRRFHICLEEVPGEDPEWGDLIVAVDGKAVQSKDELLAALEYHAVGDRVKLAVVRDIGKRQERKLDLSVTRSPEKAN